MEDTVSTEKQLLGAFSAIAVNVLVNTYAIERVAFGYEQPGDQVPVDIYLEHLHLNTINTLNGRKDIPGVYIDEQEHVSSEHDYFEYVKDLFVYKMESVFMSAPKDISLERAGEEIPLLPRFRKYLFGLLPLFTEILNVEVKYDAFDVIPTNKELQASEYPKWQKFVTAILLKPLKIGSQINRYVKDISFAPYYIRRLIEKRGKNYYLKTADIESYEYIFALFSLMQFLNAENGELLELKMRKWEQQHKS